MIINVLSAEESQKTVLRQLIELYSYDFSQYTDSDVDERGLFGYPGLDNYWTDETKHPFFIKADNHFAGFILVNMSCKYSTNKNTYNIAQFFVMKKYRGQNIGNHAAMHIFNLFKGEWEVRILNANKPALLFWHKVINEYTKENNIFHPHPALDWDGVGYTFSSNLITEGIYNENSSFRKNRY